MVLVKRLIGKGVTDSNGECSVSYVGKGTGILNIKSEAPERMISSEIYEVLDCMMISSDDQKFINYLKVSNSMGYEIDGDWIKLTTRLESGSNFGGLYWSNSNTVIYGYKLSDLLGKSLRLMFDFETEAPQLWQNVIYAYRDGNFTAISSRYVNTGDAQYLDFTVPTDIERLWVRIQSKDRLKSYVAKTKNWRLYPI